LQFCLQNLTQRNATKFSNVSTNNDRRSFSVIVNGSNENSIAISQSSQLTNNKNTQSTKSLSSSKNALNSVVKMNKTSCNANISKSAMDVNQQCQTTD